MLDNKQSSEKYRNNVAPLYNFMVSPHLEKSFNKGDNGNTNDHGKMHKNCGNYYNFAY